MNCTDINAKNLTKIRHIEGDDADDNGLNDTAQDSVLVGHKETIRCLVLYKIKSGRESCTESSLKDLEDAQELKRIVAKT